MSSSPEQSSEGLDAAALKPLVSSKLAVPCSTRRIAARERLLSRMLAERRRRCFVLQSPAGYGKTTTLVAWCRALAPFGYDVAWLSLDAADNEPSVWLDYLLASVARVEPAIARDAVLLQGLGRGQEDMERAIIALLRGIVEHRRELVIALDDLHCLTDARILEALQWLLDYAPDNLHVAFASRGPIPLSMDRLRAQDQTIELNLSDLRFSADEAERFLKAQLGEVDAASARRLNDLTDGWVSGLQLFSLGLKKKRRAPTSGAIDLTIQEQVRDARTFALYFEREVLSKLAPAELDLLTRAAACDRFCASLCTALFERNETDHARTAQLLTRLENDDLFIAPLNATGHEIWYRLHPLLRHTLLERFESWSDGTRREVHARARQWFLAHGHLGEAVHHALKAGEPARAAALIEECAQSLFLNGQMRTLASLVRQLPLAQVQSSLNLRIWMARQQLFHMESEACAASLDALDADLPAQAAADRFKVLVLRVALAIQRDDASAAAALLSKLLDPPPSADAVTVAGCHNVLSWIHMQRGEFEQAREIQQAHGHGTGGGAALIGTAAGTLMGRCFIGLSYALEGQMNQAERVYRSVLREAERHGRSCNQPACVAAALLGEVLYEQNQADAARELLERRADMIERVAVADVVLRGMLVLAGARWAAGHRLEAFAWLERLEDYGVSAALPRVLGASLAAQVFRRLSNDEFSVAQACLERLRALADATPAPDTPIFDGLRFAERSAAIRVHIATGDFEPAALALDETIAWCETHRRQGYVAKLRLQRAVVDMRMGRASAARANVVAALGIGHRLGLMRSMLDADPSVLDLIGGMAREEAFDPVLTFYVERLQSAQPRPPHVTPAQSTSTARRRAAGDGIKALSEREVEVVRLLGEALSTKKIARTLGLSPETVKWHLTNIYAKLGVSGRDEAVERMRDLA
ncbi:ATP-dependent transcription regulator LuxR [Caballeronia hypogeia]|uniref:ATP-dependent transcription regulator LuxR n=1 Tax=Caballeronia hypogeia TaxID=1777140 RepID=A0A158CQW1_9BURK|nr:LuxR C-terminal-related transcriptional regulator [Caballeronia hypogeia]SAK84246.1 ATP-dependent transcription regulator LuxR [Caballeronia hypogeia]